MRTIETPAVAIASGDSVKLMDGLPGNLRRFAGKRATVRLVFSEITHGREILFANLTVHDETGGRVENIEVKDVLVSYLRKVPAEDAKPARRSPLNLHVVKDDRTEREKQQEGIDWLKARGYQVLVTGQYMKKVQCPPSDGCGNWFWPKGFGNSVGFPDLCIYHPTRWGAAGVRRAAMLVEYKQSEKAERQPRQIELAAEGVSAFVWSLTTLLQDVYRFEDEVLGIEVHPGIIDYLVRHNCLRDGETEVAA